MMHARRERRTYRMPSHVTWLLDSRCVVLVDAAEGRSELLSGAEAVIWDWMCAARNANELLRLVAALWNVSMSTAAVRLNDLLADWCARGWLTVEQGAEEP